MSLKNNTKSEILSAMGIQQWVPREPLPGLDQSDEDILIYRLNSPTGHAGHLVISHQALANEAEAMDLLDAMLKAIHVKREPSDLTIGPALEAITGQYLIVMGRRASETILGHPSDLKQLPTKPPVFGQQSIPVIVTHHPAHLLQHPEDKRAAWQALQKALPHG